MTDNQRDIQQFAASLDEIKHLEAKLTSLKRHLVESSSVTLRELMTEGETTSFLIALVKERRFAIPVGGVEEVIEMVSPIPLADPMPGLVGLINYHGELIALFDLSDIAGLGKCPIIEDNVIVVCIMGERRFAVMIAEASDVITVPKTQIRIADEVLSGVIREIAVVQDGRDAASVIDLWSAVVALPLRFKSEPPPEKEAQAAPVEGSEG